MHCGHIACRRSPSHACELGRRASDGAHAFRELDGPGRAADANAVGDEWGSKYMADWDREGTREEANKGYKLKCGEHPGKEESK